MKRKKKKALILSVFMILLLAACSSRTNVRDGDDYIYCLNPDKTGLVKVSYEVQGEDVVEEAKDILREMQKPADETRYTPAISKKIKVQDCKLRGSILDVDFNSEYRSVKPLEEKLMRAAIVQSLLRLDGVNAVSLSVDGEPLKNADGAVIGLMNEDDFVENTVCLQQVGCEADFRTVAETLGKFQNQLADYPASTLHETIARFHDTPNRYANFEKALAADALGRAKTIAPEIAFIHAREKDCHVLLDQLAAGEIPLRVTHNDTKINNVLLDEATGKGICVIDLDTVMPGLSAYDFGDSIRTGANDCAEDEPDQSKVHFDLHLYEVFAKGYLSTAGASMSPAEKKSLAWGAKLMTLECGIRFLTDYLEGDHYFHTARPGHNLDRARTQFTLVRQMEEVFDQMLEIVS